MNVIEIDYAAPAPVPLNRPRIWLSKDDAGRQWWECRNCGMQWLFPRRRNGRYPYGSFVCKWCNQPHRR